MKAAPRTKQDQQYKKEYLSEPTKRFSNRIASTSPEDHNLLKTLRKAVKNEPVKTKNSTFVISYSRGPPSRERIDYVPINSGYSQT